MAIKTVPNTAMPNTAMVLAAGLGTRMRPLTLTTPKPLVEINGRTLLDRTLDAIEQADIQNAVVNVHYLADQIDDHLKTRKHPHITISDERDTLLDSGGGVVKALPKLGNTPFFILNSDTFWTDNNDQSLSKLAQNFDAQKMDMLLLTVHRDQAAGPERGDFLCGAPFCANGNVRTLTRAPLNTKDAVIYGGVMLVNPAIFENAQCSPHSLNVYFDRAIQKNRLFGLPLDGYWYTVGTMDMIAMVEQLLFDRGESKKL